MNETIARFMVSARLDALRADIELQYRAASAEARGFSFHRSLGQLRRFQQAIHRRT